MVSLFFELAQGVGCDGLHLRNDMVRFLLLYDFAKGHRIEHVEYVAAVGYLHCRSVGIAVAGYDLHSITLQLYRHFLAQFPAP